MKKKIFLFAGLLFSWVINSQVIGYGDAAVLFSSQDNNGTARFNAMSGAFGALGGDLSSIDINPAGTAVFNSSEVGFTLGLRNTNIITSFYGEVNDNQNDYFKINQAGGVFVFNGHNDSRFALGINYSLSKDFENTWFSSGVATDGNGDIIAPLSNFYDPDAQYEYFDGQTFSNYMDGRNEKLVLSFGHFNGDNLYLGGAINTHTIDFAQFTVAYEYNQDTDGNTFDVNAQQDLRTTGTGVSLSIGAIIKPVHSIRLGLAYETPTWYQLSEDATIYDDELIYNESDYYYEAPEDAGDYYLDYNLQTPGRFTGSFAYIFGKEGLISLDYYYKTYKGVKVKPTGDFTDVNSSLSNNLKNTSSIALGGEWRFDNISLRGGYHFEQNPYKDALDTDHIQGYSLGLGFKLNSNFKIDLAYQRDNNTWFYDYMNIDGADAVELDNTHKKFTASLVFGF